MALRVIAVIALAMSRKIVVLPAFGGETINALPLADRHDQVDDPGGEPLRSGLKPQPLIGVEASVCRTRDASWRPRQDPVDGVEPNQRIELLALIALIPSLGTRTAPVTASPRRKPFLRTMFIDTYTSFGPGQVAGGTNEGVVVEDIQDAGNGLDDVVFAKFCLAATAALAAGTVAAAPAIAEPSAAPSLPSVAIVVAVLLTAAAFTALVAGIAGVGVVGLLVVGLLVVLPVAAVLAPSAGVPASRDAARRSRGGLRSEFWSPPPCARRDCGASACSPAWVSAAWVFGLGFGGLGFGAQVSPARVWPPGFRRFAVPRWPDLNPRLNGFH